MRHRRLLAIFGLLPLLLSACVDEPTPTPTLPPPTATDTPMAVTAPAAITATLPFPTGQPLTLVTFRHRSGVFTIPRPTDWVVFDDSTDQRLMVQFIPPVGFGSRMTIEVTSPGPLTPDEMRGEAESYIARTYVGNTAYHEASRGDMADGRFRVIYDYNDGRGATGSETLVVQQSASFFVTLRVFISDSDKNALGSLPESVATGITVEPKASWGTAVGAINPAELLIVNTTMWRASSDRAYYYGDVYNVSPATITNVQVKVSICDSAGAVIGQLTQQTALREMASGGRVPFAFKIDKPQVGISVCSQAVTADPALPDASYTTSLDVQVANRPRGGFVLSLEGKVANQNLVPVKNIHLVVVIYDVSGAIVGMTEFNSTAEQLYQPGQSLPVKYTFETLAGKPDHTVTLVEAEVVPPTNPSLNP